jgi:hypothetical protein
LAEQSVGGGIATRGEKAMNTEPTTETAAESTTKAKGKTARPAKLKANGKGKTKARGAKAHHPKSGTAIVMRLMHGPHGATLATLVKASGLQPHTIRALASRHKATSSPGADGKRVYRLK